MSTAKAAGARASLAKLAALDTTVHELVSTLVATRAGRRPASGDVLRTIDGLESMIADLESNLGIRIADTRLRTLFTNGTVGDLEAALVAQVLARVPGPEERRTPLEDQRAGGERVRYLARFRR